MERSAQAGPRDDRTSFWEIFRHAAPILFERPKALALYVAALALATGLVDQARLALAEPYEVLLDAFMAARPADPASARSHWLELLEGIKSLGYGRLGLSWAAPVLLTPLTWLALCRAALSIWDGWRLGFGDLLFAVKNYLTALKIMAIISFFGVFLFLFSLLSLLPLVLVQNMAAGPAGPAWLLTMLALAAGLFFFIKILWPHLRRFLLLEFLLYLRLADGEPGPWGVRIWRLYEALRAYPAHLGQGVAIFALTFLAASLVTGILVTILGLIGLPDPVADILAWFPPYLAVLWPLTALAGFHRIILSQTPPERPAAEAIDAADAIEPEGDGPGSEA